MNENICLKKIPVASPSLIGNEKNYVNDCLDSNWISSNGPYVKSFEEEFGKYVGVKNAISCCNGTAALHLALLALEIGFGDEVIIPTLTYVSTANAVHYTGATAVLVDCEPDTWNINPMKLEALITSKTKAIIAVPLYGHPCDMDPIIELASKFGLFIVEDAAEALGSKYKGRLCGSMADISTFSFYGNKTITTGEGGMVVTDNEVLAERVRILMGQGMDLQRRYWFPVVGYNYRMTNIEAAIGLAQLENIEKFLDKRRDIASWYDTCLAVIPGIILPIEKAYARHSWWMYSILIKDDCFGGRDNLMNLLAARGVETRPFFYPMHVMPVYSNNAHNDLSVAEAVATKGINLPTYSGLSKNDVEYIADILSAVATNS